MTYVVVSFVYGCMYMYHNQVVYSRIQAFASVHIHTHTKNHGFDGIDGNHRIVHEYDTIVLIQMH